MTFANLLPARIGRPTHRSRHRAVDEVDRQRGLRVGADLLIKGLRLQLDEAEARHAETIARLDERYTATIRQLEAELADAKRRLELRNWADSVVTKTQEIDPDQVRRHCVMPLHQARDAGLLGPVLDPGHTTTH